MAFTNSSGNVVVVILLHSGSGGRDRGSAFKWTLPSRYLNVIQPLCGSDSGNDYSVWDESKWGEWTAKLQRFS